MPGYTCMLLQLYLCFKFLFLFKSYIKPFCMQWDNSVSKATPYGLENSIRLPLKSIYSSLPHLTSSTSLKKKDNQLTGEDLNWMYSESVRSINTCLNLLVCTFSPKKKSIILQLIMPEQVFSSVYLCMKIFGCTPLMQQILGFVKTLR